MCISTARHLVDEAELDRTVLCVRRDKSSNAHLVVTVAADHIGALRVVTIEPSREPQTVFSSIRPLRYIWQSLPGLGRPFTAKEERRFVKELKMYGQAESFVRDDVTTLMLALRCGSQLSTVMGQLPGVEPTRLLGAYEFLATGLHQADAEWRKLTQNPSAADPTCFPPGFTAVFYVLAGALHRLDTSELPGFIELASQRAQQARDAADMIERAITAMPQMSVESVELGRILFDPFNDSLFDAHYFCPARVGELSPDRVARLLGEDPSLTPAAQPAESDDHEER